MAFASTNALKRVVEASADTTNTATLVKNQDRVDDGKGTARIQVFERDEHASARRVAKSGEIANGDCAASDNYSTPATLVNRMCVATNSPP